MAWRGGLVDLISCLSHSLAVLARSCLAGQVGPTGEKIKLIIFVVLIDKYLINFFKFLS